ncbi:hypothetical protein H0H81_008729 [Sphagnurus paluster]|uniref:Uncharacterized protein n=1 Tax=Sphagnurus paluster TaxID=117069 RepID=A0A9P7FWR1_9AGAR|nr:hypothetical protein H0H81_008729 [Sphagnurus paluster]
MNPPPTLSPSYTLTPSHTSTSTPSPATSAANLSRGQLIGVVVASILGFIFLFILIILLYLCCKGRRKRRNPPFTMIHGGLDEGYEVVGPDGRVTWGEGSPRHSGEEADPFLRRGATGNADAEMGGRNRQSRSGNVPRVPVPQYPEPAPNGGSVGTKSSGTNSGYGEPINPTLNLDPRTTEELDRQRRGYMMSVEELERLDNQAAFPQNANFPSSYSPANYSPLIPPPRLVDPEIAWVPAPESLPFTSKSSQLSLSAYPDAHEPVTLLTARRVRVEDLASRTPPQSTQPLAGSSNRNSGGFLSNLGLGRLSWFKNLDGMGSGSRRNSRVATPVGDEDVEIGKALLAPEMTESQNSRRIGFGLGFDGDRPNSTASGRTTTTMYYDAHSSLPPTPVSGVTPITPLPPLPQPPPVPSFPPLPRAVTPPNRTSPSQQSQAPWASSTTVALSIAPTHLTHAPADRDLPDPSYSYSTSITNVNHGLPPGYDILDTPAPVAMSPFASTSSLSSLSQVREMTTGSSAGLSVHPFPPGLDALNNKSWAPSDLTSTTAATRINLNMDPTVVSLLSDQDNTPAISIDVLEEEPPTPGEGWRTLAAEQGFLDEHRRTFGQFVTPFGDLVDNTSLYSIPVHSPAGTGSAPNGSVGSRSAFSGQSLAISAGTGSVSSEAGKRGSPAMSAFGPRAPPSAHLTPERSAAQRLAPLGPEPQPQVPARRAPSPAPEPASPLSQFSQLQLANAPWVAGLDSDWTPT